MRLAIYFAPAAGTPLADFARGWLGRDARGEPVAHQPVPGLERARQAAITASPRHYGFHATLKAPFELAGGAARAEDCHAAVAELAAGWEPFEARLAVASLGGFLALMPERPCPPLDALAAACVVELDRFRAPPAADDLARRRAAGLTPRQEELLRAYGYPYVLDEFRFHMTLTGSLKEPERGRVQAALEPALAALLEPPLAIDALSIFAQPACEAPFTEIRRLGLGRRG